MIEREQPESDGEDGRDLSRRSFLAAASAGAFASAVPLVHESGTEDHAERTADEAVEFDPARHGFGFRNWRVREGPYPGGDGDTEEEFLDRWDEPFRQAFDSSLDSMPGRLREALARYAREGLLAVYDPNYAAATYESRKPTIRIDTSAAEPTVVPIGLNAVYDRFDRFLHNEYDRRIRAGYGDRTSSLTVAPEVLDRVLGRALFVDIGGPVRALVTDPGGRRIDRTGGSRVLHYRYGASTGTYSLQAIGEGDGEYSIDAYAGGHRGDLLEETIEASIEAGETHRYELTMDDDGTVDRF